MLTPCLSVCLCALQAACHKDLAVSKKAVCCIHDTVNALLNTQSELPHFHVNEALFKPLETLLCLELCDADVQDQVTAGEMSLWWYGVHTLLGPEGL